MLFAFNRVFQWHVAYLVYFGFFHQECLNGNKNEKSEEDEEAYNGINFYIQYAAEGFFKHSYFFTGLFEMSTPKRCI
jgi:hypothetical protein